LGVTACSTPFKVLGRGQARAFGMPQLPLLELPHPFGARSREEVTEIAADCATQLAQLLAGTDEK
jgi:hypothetical protein